MYVGIILYLDKIIAYDVRSNPIGLSCASMYTIIFYNFIILKCCLILVLKCMQLLFVGY